MATQWFDPMLYNLNLTSICFRFLLALVIGGTIGMERGASKHPAGFRTHILVCIGAAITIMTSQYMVEWMGNSTDMARLGAQVVTGVGFLGAGTILLTDRKRIKGLTTAAGLWASACLGLAIGIGFYEGAIVAGAVIMIALALLPKLEMLIYSRSPHESLYVEVESFEAFKNFMAALEAEKIQVGSTDYSFNGHPLTPGGIAFGVDITLPSGMNDEQALAFMKGLPGVTIVEEA